MNARLKALSLMEVSVTIVIFAIIASFTLAMFSSAYSRMRKERMETTALLLAQGEMEEVLSQSVVFPALANRTRAEVVPGFNRTVNFTCPYEGIDFLAQINVTVFWPGKTSEQSLSLYSVIAGSDEP